MNNVTAEYSLNDDGTIKVINLGYINGELKEIIGKAVTTNRDDLLCVSFKPNVYSYYRILAIDKDYKYALVVGISKNLLWILSRTPNIERNIYNKFIEIAKKNGFNTNKIIINE